MRIRSFFKFICATASSDLAAQMQNDLHDENMKIDKLHLAPFILIIYRAVVVVGHT